MPRIPILTALLVTSTALLAAVAPGPIPLEPCHLRGVEEGVLCGRYDVFENRTTGRGRMLPVAIAVLPARQRSHEPDPLVILAGGPGQGARDYAPWVDRVFRDVRRTRDIVLIDARGTGGSAPLHCVVDQSLSSRVGSPASPVIDAAGCLGKLDADVSRYANESIAADLDEILTALGYGPVNLWGGSFGTRSALVFARMFPSRVRSVVLDSAAPFELAFPAHLAEDTERALARLLDDCEQDRDCAASYPSLRADLTRLLADLERAPGGVTLADPATGAPRMLVVDRRFVASAIRGALYSPLDSSVLPLALSRASSGEFGPLFALVARLAGDSVDTMALGATLAVICTEDVPRIGTSNASAEATLMRSMMIDEWRAMCRGWPAGPLPDIAPRRLAIPALVISGELDPVTPPRWGEAMARNFAGARHVIVLGAAHNAGLSGCAPRLIARFIESGSAEGLDTSCAARGARASFAIGATGPRP